MTPDDLELLVRRAEAWTAEPAPDRFAWPDAVLFLAGLACGAWAALIAVAGWVL